MRSPYSQELKISASEIAFPLERLTDTQREMYRLYLEWCKTVRSPSREPLWLALVLSCERPASQLSLFNRSEPEKPWLPEPGDPPITVKEVAETFGLVYNHHTDDVINIARTQWRFDMLPSNRNISDAHHRRWGCFFGYPAADIDHFLTTEPPYLSAFDLVEDGVFTSEEVAYAWLAPQRHEATVEGFERAIDTGKYYEEVITDLATMWNLPELAQWLDDCYQDAIDSSTTPDQGFELDTSVDFEDLIVWGELITEDFEDTVENLTVWARPPITVPENMPGAEVGGMYIALNGEISWKHLTQVRDTITDQFDTIGLPWRFHDEKERREDSEEGCYVGIITEQVEKEHILRSKWIEDFFN